MCFSNKRYLIVATAHGMYLFEIATTTYIGYAELITMPIRIPNTSPAIPYLNQSMNDPSLTLYFFMIFTPLHP